MEIPGGKTTNSPLSFKYTASNEALVELNSKTDEERPNEFTNLNENASPKRLDKTSLIDKYFKSIRPDKDKDEAKSSEEKLPSKDVTSSPVKEYLNRLGKKSVSETPTEAKEGTYETWKIFHDFKYKLTQAVEDIKTKSTDETRDKSVPRDNSMSDSEENSAMKDLDQQSVGDTDNQVSSLESSIQNLSEITQPITAKANERDLSLPIDLKNSESSDDTHKNLVRSESLNGSCDLLDDNVLEVESGIEALEDNYVDFNDLPEDKAELKINQPNNNAIPKTSTMYGSPNNGKLPKPENPASGNKNHFSSFQMYILTICLVVSYILLPNWSLWNGFLLGLWCYCFGSCVKEWFLDTYMCEEPRKKSFSQLKKSVEMPVMYTIPSVKEYTPLKKYEGWINHYRYPNYDPFVYNINKTTTAFVKLEGCNLRISYTKTKIPKRAFWDEKIENVIFYQHRLYNLTGARVILLPDGLVKRRLWSKKYPLCIILSDKEKIQVLEKENMPPEKKEMSPEKKNRESQQEESTETSPEKKKKFVWRRREKSVSHSEGESSKEGLRHRFVRKMCKDKKLDAEKKVDSATDTEFEKPEQQDQATQDDESTYKLVKEEEELDENEIRRIKELLDDTELESTGGTLEAEWSVHVKESKDQHAHLYFFTRTGRDKHEWYRRISTAILEANASAESSTADDRSSSENPETKDGIEMATYKTSDRESVSFSKYTKSFDGQSDIYLTKTGQLMPSDLDSYEKTFWPYLHKILQIHDVIHKHSVETGIMCQIEPTPAKSKKRKKNSKTPSPTCDCRMISPEVTWVNTLLARVIYDVTRDPKISNRLQHRVQRKLNTLKLPSFMSPLLVTELSLCGACPLIERVGGGTFDERGIWLDADLRYDGGALITVLTQINLMKLKDKNITLEEQLSDSEFVVDLDSSLPSFGEKLLARKRKSAVYDSDVEDSAESSSDDESPPLQPIDSNTDVSTQDLTMSKTGGSSKTKFLKMVDKIATNKYFQQVTDYKYVKRAMEGLSNTDIKLQIEVHGLEGRLVVNLPPPPHDRLWLGFRSNPQLVLKARPAVGARTLRFTQISNWIEQKLSKEFERVLVLPNMEDFIIDLMTPTPVQFE